MSAPRAKRGARALDIVEQPRACDFFSGLQHEACQVGVRYRDVRRAHGAVDGRGASWPCFPTEARVPVSCSQFRYSTPEEIAEEERAFEEAFRRIQGGTSPCCDAPLTAVGGGWKACSNCGKDVVHQCERGARS